VTLCSSTIIDHIYTNKPYNVIEINTPAVSLSDHFPVCFTRKVSSTNLKNNESNGFGYNVINFRSMKNFNEKDFITDLENQPFSVIDIFDDPNDALDYFCDLFLNVLNIHAPKKRRRVKFPIQQPWFSKDITEATKTRDYFKKIGDIENYRKSRNIVQSLIHETKKSYFSKTINNNKRNPKEIWKNLNLLSSKPKIQASQQQINDNDGNSITNPEAIANIFNNFFTSLSDSLHPTHNLRTKTPSQTLIDFVNSKIENAASFDIPLLNKDFVIEQLKTLSSSKSTGLDGLSARFLKLSADVVAESITKILNLSLQTGIYPKQFKLAKVTPIFKKGLKHDVNNYRPISILPIMSKIIERHVSNQIKQYLKAHNLLHERQSGFRSNHSCETALTAMVDDWIMAIDNNQFSGTVFLDLSKAFDLIDHELLLSKLSAYKFHENSIKWFQSYLGGRTQKVSVANVLSESKSISCGVPQGSVLGPLLFIIFINDMPLSTQHSTTNMFADDSSITYSSGSISDVTNALNEDLSQIEQWCSQNSMKINTTKTKAMFITSHAKNKAVLNSDNQIQLANENIEISNSEKLLGVHIDSKLTWHIHVENTLKKCNSLLYLLGRIKYYLSIPMRKLYFNSYILPHLDYCCTIWGNCNSDLINSVICFQKRAARLILDVNIDTSSETLFKELRWMKFDERIKFKKAIMMYKVCNKIAPDYLQQKFTYVSDIHSKNLRSQVLNSIYVPKPNLEISRKTFTYSGSKIWNSLPDTVKNASTVQEFKAKYLDFTYNLPYSLHYSHSNHF
jgi:hypothetical protein